MSATGHININDSIIYELDKMERFSWGDYSIAIQQFSRFIRGVVWNENNALLVSVILSSLNAIYSLFFKEIQIAEYELVDFYMKQFKRAWVNYQPFHPTREQWGDIERKVEEILTGLIIKKQWDILNPYIDTNDDENFGKGLLSIINDMFRHSDDPPDKVTEPDFSFRDFASVEKDFLVAFDKLTGNYYGLNSPID